MVDVEDKGKDLKDVQELIKRADSVVEYMGGLEKRIKVRRNHGYILCKLLWWGGGEGRWGKKNEKMKR